MSSDGILTSPKANHNFWTSRVNAAEKLLIDEIRSGDQQAWEQFISRYEGRLLAFVESRLRNRSVSEDVVQETFVGFLTSLPNYSESTPVDSFLFSIAAHKLTDVLRKQGRRPTVPLMPANDDRRSVEPAGPSRRASSMMRSREDRIAEQQVVAECLSELIAGWLQNGEFERLECAELLFVLGWRNRDVATHLGITEQAVANHKFFVVSKLKDAAARAQLQDPLIPELQGETT